MFGNLRKTTVTQTNWWWNEEVRAHIKTERIWKYCKSDENFKYKQAKIDAEIVIDLSKSIVYYNFYCKLDTKEALKDISKLARS